MSRARFVGADVSEEAPLLLAMPLRTSSCTTEIVAVAVVAEGVVVKIDILFAVLV